MRNKNDELFYYTILCKLDGEIRNIYRLTSFKASLKEVVKDIQVGGMIVFNDGPMEKAIPLQNVDIIVAGWFNGVETIYSEI